MKLLTSEAAAGIVAGAAFIASAGHIVHTVNESNPIWFSLVYPVGIDGLLYVGIRALQAKRVWAGMAALLVGAFYSLAFNADAEGALTMPRLLIASSMPIAMFVAFLIEATGHKAKDVEVREVEKIVTVYPNLLPIVPPAQKPIRVHAETPKPKPVAKPIERPAITSGTPGRKTGWDVEKAVALIADGRTDGDVIATVDGLGAKPLQRTRRVVRLLAEDASRTDETIREIMKAQISIDHIARVRAAMKGE